MAPRGAEPGAESPSSSEGSSPVMPRSLPDRDEELVREATPLVALLGRPQGRLQRLPPARVCPVHRCSVGAARGDAWGPALPAPHSATLRQ